MFNRASMKLGLEQAVLGDSAGTLKPRDMEDLLKKGAYALTQMDEIDAMRCGFTHCYYYYCRGLQNFVMVGFHRRCFAVLLHANVML